MKLKHLIDDIAIDFWSFTNFISMKNIRRKYNQMVDLSKFISKKKILSGVVAIYYNQVYNQTCPEGN